MFLKNISSHKLRVRTAHVRLCEFLPLKSYSTSQHLAAERSDKNPRGTWQATTRHPLPDTMLEKKGFPNTGRVSRQQFDHSVVETQFLEHAIRGFPRERRPDGERPSKFVDPIPDQCWSSVCDAGLALIRHWEKMLITRLADDDFSHTTALGSLHFPPN